MLRVFASLQQMYVKLITSLVASCVVCVHVFITIELWLNEQRGKKFVTPFFSSYVLPQEAHKVQNTVSAFIPPAHAFIITALNVEKSLVWWAGSCFAQQLFRLTKWELEGMCLDIACGICSFPFVSSCRLKRVLSSVLIHKLDYHLITKIQSSVAS